jgi:FtsH-binding integral membrane protein
MTKSAQQGTKRQKLLKQLRDYLQLSFWSWAVLMGVAFIGVLLNAAKLGRLQISAKGTILAAVFGLAAVIAVPFIIWLCIQAAEKIARAVGGSRQQR